MLNSRSAAAVDDGVVDSNCIGVSRNLLFLSFHSPPAFSSSPFETSCCSARRRRPRMSSFSSEGEARPKSHVVFATVDGRKRGGAGGKRVERADDQVCTCSRSIDDG
jgi:hypothetical protein